MRRFILVIVVLAGCDVCWAAKVHQERCANGDSDSCEWLTNNAPGAVCSG